MPPSVSNKTQPLMTKEKIISVKSNLLWLSIPWRESGMLVANLTLLSSFLSNTKHFCQALQLHESIGEPKLYLTLGQIQDFKERGLRSL